MSVSPESCILYTTSNQCTITLHGESVGTATFSTTAAGYIESTSESLAIVPFVISGTFSINNYSGNLANESYGGIITADINLDSSSGVSNLAPMVVSGNVNVISVVLTDPSCTLSTSSPTCQVTITGTGVGSTTFTASSGSMYTATSSAITIPTFSCIADGSTACGCLHENDGSGLTWYADASKSGSWTDWCTKSQDTNGNCNSNGESITAFNSGDGHCGYTDWHLPSTVDVSGQVAAAGGQWGTLGTFASFESGGAGIGSNFQSWLTAQGFTGVYSDGAYWSSISMNTNSAYYVNFSDGTITSNFQFLPGNILLVRH